MPPPSNQTDPNQQLQPWPAPTRNRILIVEDDPASGHALRQLLGRRGFNVNLVKTLSSAILALNDRPDYMILDLMLPDGPGEKALQLVRSRGLATRVVVTTAATDPTLIQQVQAMAPDLLLRKPIDLNELLAAMQRLT